MTATLAQLASYGIPEAVAREHSQQWMLGTVEALTDRRKRELADQLRIAALGAAAGFGSKEASAEIDRVLEQLTPADEESLAHLLNPDALTDLPSVASFTTPQPGAPRPPLAVERVRVTPEERHG